MKRSAISGCSYTNLATDVTATNYTNVGLTNVALYYFVVSGMNVAGESGNSSEASARPLPLIPPQLSLVITSEQLQLMWPADHLGWRLQAQINNLNAGLSTNWFTIPDSANLNQLSLPMGAIHGGVFFRLAYP